MKIISFGYKKKNPSYRMQGQQPAAIQRMAFSLQDSWAASIRTNVPLSEGDCGISAGQICLCACLLCPLMAEMWQPEHSLAHTGVRYHHGLPSRLFHNSLWDLHPAWQIYSIFTAKECFVPAKRNLIFKEI